MITIKIGDLLQSEAQTLVNTVNTVGIMGKGIAAEFKKQYPNMFRDYARRCRKQPGDPQKVVLGKPYLYRPLINNQLSFGDEAPIKGKWILNFPTKDHWRGASDLDAIEAGLDHLMSSYRSWGITSLAVPPLGCGYGGLEWRVVGPRLYRRLSKLEIPVELYAPFGTDPDELDEAFLSGSSPRSSGRPDEIHTADLVVAILAIDLAANWDITVNQTRLRSLAYFVAAAGIPRDTTLSWTPHGVRDEAFTRTARQFLRNSILTEAKRGRARIVLPGATASDTRRLIANDLHQWKTEIRRVVDLQTRLREYGLVKIAGSAHYAATHRILAGADIVAAISQEFEQTNLGTSPRREHQIQVIVSHLHATGFLEETAGA